MSGAGLKLVWTQQLCGQMLTQRSIAACLAPCCQAPGYRALPLAGLTSELDQHEQP